MKSNTEQLKWVFERLNAHDTDSLRAVWNDQTVEYFPDRTCYGADEIAQWFEEKFAAIEGFRLEVISMVDSGNDALVHWRMTGRHVGTVLGVSGTGRSIEVDGIDHFVLKDGFVVSNTVVYDQLLFARQIGLMPPDGSPLERVLKTAFNAKTRALSLVRKN
ncbi:ester cyclase [Smaragdicoccus niigatensis]|uniref:ester cyclase n=1 Tax=Smaragdicoccus niigatensis TaxID=359359 RepID=UPI0003629921|nr:ester cyclase [Smaragdicoccus niigatensis]